MATETAIRPSVAALKARHGMGDLLNRVEYRHERISLTRHGKEVAVLIPVEDADLLEALEDKLDAEEALQALKEFRESGEDSIPLQDLL